MYCCIAYSTIYYKNYFTLRLVAVPDSGRSISKDDWFKNLVRRKSSGG
ncbi:MAG TPA: hypothetical protein VIY47_13250 [Ignavibacteriaceae bacterium]